MSVESTLKTGLIAALYRALDVTDHMEITDDILKVIGLVNQALDILEEE